jgi:hypothetical protein
MEKNFFKLSEFKTCLMPRSIWLIICFKKLVFNSSYQKLIILKFWWLKLRKVYQKRIPLRKKKIFFHLMKMEIIQGRFILRNRLRKFHQKVFKFTKKINEIEIQIHMRVSYVVLEKAAWLINMKKPLRFLHREDNLFK